MCVSFSSVSPQRMSLSDCVLWWQATKYGGIERVDAVGTLPAAQQPRVPWKIQMFAAGALDSSRWLSGDYYNVDSNIAKWGKHEAKSKQEQTRLSKIILQLFVHECPDSFAEPSQCSQREPRCSSTRTGPELWNPGPIEDAMSDLIHQIFWHHRAIEDQITKLVLPPKPGLFLVDQGSSRAFYFKMSMFVRTGGSATSILRQRCRFSRLLFLGGLGGFYWHAVKNALICKSRLSRFSGGFASCWALEGLGLWPWSSRSARPAMKPRRLHWGWTSGSPAGNNTRLWKPVGRSEMVSASVKTEREKMVRVFECSDCLLERFAQDLEQSL